jgi:putative hydrolases of HD superfamily
MSLPLDPTLDPPSGSSLDASLDASLALSLDGRAARLHEQMEFLVEIDALKRVLRQTPIVDGSRRENTAEHSWHLAMFAVVLAEHAAEPVDVSKVVMMLLLHDIVEIDAGDVFVYAASDSAIAAQQAADEQAAAHRIFSLLPVDQAARLRALWDEFESRATPESRFAKSIDRLQPIVLNRRSGGGSWGMHEITADQTRGLITRTITAGSPTLTAYAMRIVDEAVAEGLLLPDPATGC